MGKGEKLATWYNSGNVHKCELQLIILVASSIAWVLSLGFVGGKGKCVLLMKERYVRESQKIVTTCYSTFLQDEYLPTQPSPITGSLTGSAPQQSPHPSFQSFLQKG